MRVLVSRLERETRERAGDRGQSRSRSRPLTVETFDGLPERVGAREQDFAD
jgi:hypothetical protein